MKAWFGKLRSTASTLALDESMACGVRPSTTTQLTSRRTSRTIWSRVVTVETQPLATPRARSSRPSNSAATFLPVPTAPEMRTERTSGGSPSAARASASRRTAPQNALSGSSPTSASSSASTAARASTSTPLQQRRSSLYSGLLALPAASAARRAAAAARFCSERARARRASPAERTSQPRNAA
eukprot:scaffold267808_cov25-Tisochrysis_lutea.AAC.5